jgi:hypothetical protein
MSEQLHNQCPCKRVYVEFFVPEEEMLRWNNANIATGARASVLAIAVTIAVECGLFIAVIFFMGAVQRVWI